MVGISDIRLPILITYLAMCQNWPSKLQDWFFPVFIPYSLLIWVKFLAFMYFLTTNYRKMGRLRYFGGCQNLLTALFLGMSKFAIRIIFGPKNVFSSRLKPWSLVEPGSRTSDIDHLHQKLSASMNCFSCFLALTLLKVAAMNIRAQYRQYYIFFTILHQPLTAGC